MSDSKGKGGHLDQYNIQSGRFIRTFTEEKEEKEVPSGKNGNKVMEMGTAHSEPISGLVFSGNCSSELISAGKDGVLRFWDIRTGKKKNQIKSKSSKQIEKAVACQANSLIAMACSEPGHNDSIVLIDCLTKRAVRVFNKIPSKKITALCFSSDGQWILTADNERFIRIFDISTSRMVDMILFSKPCIGMAFNPTGEFLATLHQDERAIFIWANKSQFATRISLRSYPYDFIRKWENLDEDLDIEVTRVVIDSDDDDDDIHDDVIFEGPSMDAAHLTYSGLPPSRWENLPEIGLIKERNKPIEPPRKTKQVPFFLAASATMTGFEFDAPKLENESEQRKRINAKRNLLELETNFTQKLKKAETKFEFLAVFDSIKAMSVSSIDYEIRSLPHSALPKFLQMLLEMLKERRDFDIVQSLMASAVKIHRSELWEEQDDEDSKALTRILEEIEIEQEKVWSPFENLLGQNATLIQWVKNALL
ncbi:hypothetical protein WR25_10534 [Diploscapter pachys]|uniref:WDR36/Utp21 C-terminal domain-containing protein n=1 Tax=Diploscapter pachys TaxID=2018661 RepID=A0A2A2LUT5_9BILA|nr:hypothetical protein WR25_10534 [Diploscapter pachys]